MHAKNMHSTICSDDFLLGTPDWHLNLEDQSYTSERPKENNSLRLKYKSVLSLPDPAFPLFSTRNSVNSGVGGWGEGPATILSKPKKKNVQKWHCDFKGLYL